MADNNIVVNLSADVEAVMEERGIRMEDIQVVIEAAESSGEKLSSESTGHFLAKKRLENIMAYAEYTLADNVAEVVDVYSHRVSLQEEQ